MSTRQVKQCLILIALIRYILFIVMLS